MRLIFFVLSILTVACQRLPDSYPPPEQRHPLEGDDPIRAGIMVNMNDQDAKRFFVKDISDTLEGRTWRWTQKRPTVKILLLRTHGLKFVIDFTLWDGAIGQTGPPTISFFVGDRLLEKVRYDTPGYKHFEKAVPAGWLQTSEPTLVSAEIDKMYVAPEDKVTLGFILTRMGFERE